MKTTSYVLTEILGRVQYTYLIDSRTLIFWALLTVISNANFKTIPTTQSAIPQNFNIDTPYVILLFFFQFQELKMTISYTADVANASNFGVFTRILLRWKGSVYKLVYKELMAFLALYFILNIIYRNVLCVENPTEAVIHYR